MKKPLAKKHVVLKQLIDVCDEYINAVDEGKADDYDTHYIFESAIEVLYGPDVWDWINSRD
jgi:hypothetical protein